MSGGLLQARARQIAETMGVTSFKGSSHFIQNWARRFNLHNMALWGTGSSADAAGAAERVAKIREEPEGCLPEHIYDVDKMGLFFRCIRDGAYVVAGQRRRARGTKAMKAKDRVTLVLACNATGTHKIPVAIIGKAKRPLCFKLIRAACALPYFAQKSAWMDKKVNKMWFESVFLPAVTARGSTFCVLISDNRTAHGEMQHESVKFVSLPPNCTSI